MPNGHHGNWNTSSSGGSYGGGEDFGSPFGGGSPYSPPSTASEANVPYDPGPGDRGGETQASPYVPTPGTEYGDEFGGWKGSSAQAAAVLQAEKDKDAKLALAEELRHKQEERERTGTTYKPSLTKKGSAIGSGDLMAAEFFGMDDPNALYAWTDEKGIGHTGTLEEMAIARGWTSKDGKLTGKVPGFGQMTDIDKYKYGMYDYGEFGYGPGPQWDKELIEFFGNKPEEGFSHAQLTEYLYGQFLQGKESIGITDEMFLGGKPGQIGYGPGEKPAWYGKPRTGTTGGGSGGGYGYGYGYGGGGGGGGYGYGPAGGPTPQQMANYYTPQANLQQAMINVHTGGYKRGGIVSLLRLS